MWYSSGDLRNVVVSLDSSLEVNFMSGYSDLRRSNYKINYLFVQFQIQNTWIYFIQNKCINM